MKKPKLTKVKLKVLERIFEGEMKSHLPVQLRSKWLPELVKEGLVHPTKEVLPGRFPVTIKGWNLTDLGAATYHKSDCGEIIPPLT